MKSSKLCGIFPPLSLDETSHADRSATRLLQSTNISRKSVTLDVSQLSIPGMPVNSVQWQKADQALTHFDILNPGILSPSPLSEEQK